MKNLFIFIAVLVMAGCTTDLTQLQDNTAPAPIQVTNRVGNSSQLHYRGVEQFTHNKHDYLVFSISNDHGLQICVVHDPDCKCHKQHIIDAEPDDYTIEDL